MGLTVHGRKKQVTFDHPFLPESLRQVDIYNLPVKDSTVDVVLERYDHAVGVNVKRRDGAVEVVTIT